LPINLTIGNSYDVNDPSLAYDVVELPTDTLNLQSGFHRVRLLKKTVTNRWSYLNEFIPVVRRFFVFTSDFLVLYIFLSFDII
jgi:hypothetical protein